MGGLEDARAEGAAMGARGGEQARRQRASRRPYRPARMCIAMPERSTDPPTRGTPRPRSNRILCCTADTVSALGACATGPLARYCWRVTTFVLELSTEFHFEIDVGYHFLFMLSLIHAVAYHCCSRCVVLPYYIICLMLL